MGAYKEHYDQIIGLPHHTSDKHKHMSLTDRGAQFAPFAALTGYDDGIKEAARLTGGREEQDEDAKARLDSVIAELNSRMDEQPQVKVTYFVKDSLKEGGRYETRTGNFRRIEYYRGRFVFTDGFSAELSDISEIEIIPFVKPNKSV